MRIEIEQTDRELDRSMEVDAGPGFEIPMGEEVSDGDSVNDLHVSEASDSDDVPDTDFDQLRQTILLSVIYHFIY